MNKNLKKVISAVAALSLSASSIAAFAAGFPDVEETASYAQAVQELSALGVISGYDDGTFQPDNLVTRAEISKMIVDALAEGSEAAAASNSSNFADVRNAGTDGHWATGYINQGVTDGWIAGYDENSFGPDDNVTYVQAQKMLVAAIGYDVYATAKGGWPSGYKLYASSLKITNGVQGVSSDDQQLTRAQVAQMIDNAMDAPLCVIDSYSYDSWGNLKPDLDVKDGEGKDYQTLFTDKHDAYKVYGRVTDTSKANTAIDTDKVEFQVEKADNFDDEYIKSSDPRDPEDMYYGDTNAPDMLKTYAQALIQKNDDDEFTILSITAAAANKTVTVAAEDIDETKTLNNIDKNVLYFYPAGTTRNSQKYELADDFEVYINGVLTSMDASEVADYIIADDTLAVTLMKTTETGSTSTSSKYNVIMVTEYATAVVDQVVEKSDTTTVTFKKTSNNVGKLTVDKDTEDVTYSFTLDGEEIDAADLQEFDVLSIAYNSADDATFADSNFYNVIVSRDTVEAKYTGVNSAGDEFTFDGTKYKQSYDKNNRDSFETSTEYTLYLDSFGRIAYSDELSSTKKVGILKNVYQKTNGDWIAEVITKDGEITEFTVDDADGSTYQGYVTSTGGTAQADVKTTYPKRVIEYKTTSSGKLTIKSVYDVADVSKGEYKESTSKLGSYKISDATTIIDISNADNKKDDIKVISKDNLKDGVTYTAYAYDKSSSDKTYRFVILTDGDQGINSTSELAIFVESGTDENADGNEADTMTVYVNGEEETYFVADEIDLPAFQEGDVVIFSTNSSDEVDEIYSAFDGYGVVNAASWDDFKADALAGDVKVNATTLKAVEDIDDGDEDTVSLAFGAIIKDGNSYILVPASNIDSKGVASIGASGNIDLDISGAQIYSYNYANNKKNAARLTIDDGMQATLKVDAAYSDNDTKYDLNNDIVGDSVVFALVRTFDKDEAQEIYLIIND